ncbi:MAG: DUF1501 domain-containing protein, partial [Planctomycetota bacterium]
MNSRHAPNPLPVLDDDALCGLTPRSGGTLAERIYRREFLRRSGLGLATLALAGLLDERAAGAVRRPHFPGRARHVIHVMLNGGMSQVDTFDPKPELTRRAGQMLPYENLQTERKTGVALPSPFRFRRCGESGIPISDIFPHLREVADELLVIRSMHAELPNHEMSLMLLNTGDMRLVRPSFGSWLTWGMGTENANLPGFVAMVPGGMPVAGAANWRSAFLPGAYQGTYVDTSKPDPRRLIENVHNNRMQPAEQRAQFELLQTLNARHLERRPHEAALEARIRSFELAYRMQIEATDAFDVQQEPKHILEM